MISGLPELSAALFTAILHSIWQGCVLAVLFAVVSRQLQSSQSRYLLAMASFLAATLAFVATFLHTLSQVSVVVLPSTVPAEPSLAPVFALAWCIGAAFVGGRYFLGWLWLRLVIVRRSVEVPANIQALFDDARRAVDAPGRILVRASASIRSPMVTGVIQPIVLLPVAMLSGVPANVLTAVFTHELLHVRRFDHVAVFLQAFGETLLFFHPAVRWLSAEARRYREYRCDDESVRHLGNRFDYANALVSIEESAGGSTLPALLMNGDDLMNRVERLVCKDSGTESTRLHFAGMLAFASIALLAYSLSFAKETRQDASEQQAESHELSIAWLPPSVAQWSGLIEEAAERHDVSANVLALMLLVESHGESLATSSFGARGLMQVMPKTGEAIASQRGIADFNVDQLFEPATNIDFGAWYLAQMMERFADQPERNQELAITAYNAGPGAVSAYLSGNKPLRDETVGYRDMLMSMLSEADESRSLVLEGRKADLRERIPAFMPPVEGRVSSQFGKDGAGKEMHRGVDIAAPMGTPVVAPVRGDVKTVGEDDKRGKYITVRHAYGVESRYYHLSEISVSVGDKLEAGDRLGDVGNSGVSSGPHLHFEVRELGQPVSPSLYGLVLE